MARYVGMGASQVFRAVLTMAHPGGAPFQSVRGPYSSEGQAKAQITRERRRTEARRPYSAQVIDGYVETSELNWRRV